MTMTTDPSTARFRLYELLKEVTSGRLTIGEFCAQFETTFNLEVDKHSLAPEELVAFGNLFEQVVWYSPFADERVRVPNYRGDSEILAAITAAEQMLSKSHPN